MMGYVEFVCIVGIRGACLSLSFPCLACICICIGEQVAQWKETCESMKADRKGLILKSAVDDERKSLLRRVEELDASLFDAQSLSQRLESELEEAKERIDHLSQSGLASDENRPRYSTGDHQHVR